MPPYNNLNTIRQRFFRVSSLKDLFDSTDTHTHARTHARTHTHTRLTALFPGLPWWAGTRKVKTNLNFTEARDSEWQRHQLGHMQVCTLLQTDNHASTSPLSFLQAGCRSCRPTNSVKALKARHSTQCRSFRWRLKLNDIMEVTHHKLKPWL